MSMAKRHGATGRQLVDGYLGACRANQVFDKDFAPYFPVGQDQGLVEGRAAELLRLRRDLAAEHIQIWADVAVKHSAPLAERDLALRGPGELLGTRQTGLMGLRFADPQRDAVLLPEWTSADERDEPPAQRDLQLRDRLGLGHQWHYYWDSRLGEAGLAPDAPPSLTLTQRDEPLSRRRWQFTQREEYMRMEVPA